MQFFEPRGQKRKASAKDLAVREDKPLEELLQHKRRCARVIKLPILGESNNTNLWPFWGISLITVHSLGW